MTSLKALYFTTLIMLYCGTLTVLMPTSALAQSSPASMPQKLTLTASYLPRIEIGVDASTLGAGVDIGIHNPGDLLGLSIQAHLFDFGYHSEEDLATTHLQETLQNESVILDIYPTRGHFYLSAGIIFNQNKSNYTATPLLTPAFLKFFAGYHYAGPIGNVSGPITYNSICPYIGGGYSWDLSHNLSVNANLGVMYQGNGRVTFTPTGFMAVNPTMRAAIEANAYQAAKIFDTMSFFPVLSFAVVYRF